MKGNFQSVTTEKPVVKEPVAAPKKEVVTGNSPYTREQLLSKWSEYIELKLSGKPRLVSFFTKNKPKFINDYTLKITTSNKNQHDYVVAICEELNGYLKTMLNNSSIKINVELDESQQNENKKYYTDDDKLKHLCKKNPSIAKLAQTFNLDFE